jgi:hypothetical protein
LRLLPSQRDELVKAVAPVVAVTRIFHAKTAEEMGTLVVPEEWTVALRFAKEKGARLVVYRIEHLATTKERGERLRALVAAEVPLYVHKDWPFPTTIDLRWLADYSDAFYFARERDRAMRSREGLRQAVLSGNSVGRRPYCRCYHKWSDHEGGGMCLVAGCDCTAYEPPVENSLPSVMSSTE